MNLTDNWIVGFVDGDGCFKSYQAGQGKRYVFVVSQNKRSVDVLYALKTRFGCGSVNSAGGGGNMFEYRVGDKEQLKTIILPFFCKNPLKTVKLNDLKKFYQELMGCEMMTQETPVCRDWLTGFIDAEANFYVSMSGNYPRPQFLIGLHLRDENILHRISAFLNCDGIVYEKKVARGAKKKKNYAVFQISRQEGFMRIISICKTDTNHCLLKTTKRFDFLKFEQIIRIIQEKEHLKPEGISKIKTILNKNKKRIV